MVSSSLIISFVILRGVWTGAPGRSLGGIRIIEIVGGWDVLELFCITFGVNLVFICWDFFCFGFLFFFSGSRAKRSCIPTTTTNPGAGVKGIFFTI